jgi:GTP cyclohydrolase I
MSTARLAPFRTTAEEAADAVISLLRAVGEDPAREGLVRTPERVAKSLAFLTSGQGRDPKDVLNGAVFADEYEGMLLVKDIEFYSLCEHHLLPFHGRAHIAYVPDGRIVGLSKLPRLLEIFARRLQVQERLTRQVAVAVDELLRPRGVAVRLEASHFCMKMRGVEKQGSTTETTAMLGEFKTSAALRTEFLAAVRGGRG